MMRGEIFCPDTLESNQFYVIFPVWVNWNIRNMLPPLVLRECVCRVAPRGALEHRSAPTQTNDKIRDKKITGPAKGESGGLYIHICQTTRQFTGASLRSSPGHPSVTFVGGPTRSACPAYDHLAICYLLVLNLLVNFSGARISDRI
jgi:hypothetical protein